MLSEYSRNCDVTQNQNCRLRGYLQPLVAIFVIL